MQAIKIPKFSQGQMLTGTDWATILSLPDTIMRTLLFTSMFTTKGMASKWVTFGFDMKAYNVGKPSVLIGPGVAVLNDIVVSSQGNHDHFIIFDDTPNDGDILWLTYSYADDTDSEVFKRTINDLTPANSPRGVFIEGGQNVYTVKKYIPKLFLTSPTAMVDERYSIPLMTFSANVDDPTKSTFIPGKIAIITLDDHKKAPVMDHLDGSVNEEHLSSAITGQSARKKVVMSTLKEMSDFIYALAGKYPKTLNKRIDMQIDPSGKWVVPSVNADGDYNGIDDIVQHIAEKELGKGQSGNVHKPTESYTELAYHSDYTPSIGWLTTDDQGNRVIKLNPAAFFHIAPGSQYAVRNGHVVEDGSWWVDIVFDSSNSLPIVDPPFDILLSKIGMFASLRRLEYEIEGTTIETITIKTLIEPHSKDQASHSPGGAGTDEIFMVTTAQVDKTNGFDSFSGDTNYILVGVV